MSPPPGSEGPRLLLRPPPDLPEPEQHGGAAMTALPMLGSLGSLAVMLSFSGTSAVPGGRVRMMLAGSVFLLTTVILVAVQLDRASRTRRQRIHLARTAYFLHLDEIRATIREHASAQRRLAVRPGHIRIGVATQPVDLEIVLAPGGPRADPVATAAAERLIEVQSNQPGLPVTFDLAAERWISITGDTGVARSVARSIVCAAATEQSARLLVAIAADPSRIVDWDWLKWLPDAVVLSWPEDYSAIGTGMGSGATQHVLLLVDGATTPPDDLPPRVTVIELHGDTKGRTIDCSATDTADHFDVMSGAMAEATARRIACLETNPGTPDLMTMLDLPLPGTREPGQAWTRGHGPSALCVPIGVTDAGAPLTLDLKESAVGGMGPHGLIVGATGSGKSELLRTLVLGLALTHAPSTLNFVLVDFKGGATFAGFVDLPHVSALVTNLAQETTAVERMQDALEGEVVRRQQILRAAGDFASIREYAAARAAGRQCDGRPLAPLPALVIVIDEFAELLAARPEFLDVFVAIGRVGRSLGLHLVLASQRLEEGRLRGLEAHLSYRIALRTFSESESRAVIGAPDAAHLPPVPGAGLLRSDPAILQRFDTAYVSGAMPQPDLSPARIEPFGLSGHDRLDQRRDLVASTELDQQAPSLREAVVASLAGRGERAHRIWLPPLGPPIALGRLFEDLAVDPALGLTSRSWRQRGPLIVPLGVVDRPRDQRRDVLTADLRGAAGHVIVVGGARSGKTTFLQTFAISTGVLNTPAEARLFIIDASGGLTDLQELPHVAGLAGAADPDVVRRIVDEVASLIDEREAHQQRGGIFLMVDGWDRLNSIQPDLQTSIHDIGQRGLAVNVHLVVSASRWGEMRIATRELFGTRVELRQGDPLDSEIDRRAAAAVPTSQPGRGIAPGPWQILTALPHLDTGDVAASVGRIAEAWSGPPAPRLRVLPSAVLLSGLPTSVAARIGVRERDLEIVQWDAQHDQHLLVFGDSGSGKSNLLRTLGHEIARTHTPQQAQLVVISHRGSLAGEFADDHLLHCLRSPDETRHHIADVARLLTQRLARPTGPDVFVLVDDYDLMGGPESPLGPLLPLLFQARDVGLHLLLARRASGASRAMFEPVIQALRDVGAPGLLLSGNPDEGPLLSGVRPAHALPGRAKLITRDTVEVCQIAWTEPTG